MRHTVLPSGGRMSVQTVCLGWHWEPYRYVRSVDGVPVAEFPAWLGELARDGVAAAYGDATRAAAYDPDCALINYYDEAAKMGMHRDREERVDAPVVSLSVGAACTFRFGNTVNRKAPYTDVELRSGDLFVFGGPSRFAYHGVVRPIQPGPTTRRSGSTAGGSTTRSEPPGCSAGAPASAQRRPGAPAPVLGRDVRDRLAEAPLMSAEILGRVLALAIGLVGGRSENRGAASGDPCVVSVDVADPDQDRVAAGQHRRAVTRGDDHAAAAGNRQLRAVIARLPAQREAERVTQPADRFGDVVVDELRDHDRGRHRAIVDPCRRQPSLLVADVRDHAPDPLSR